MDNVVSIAPQKHNIKRLGITLSFLLEAQEVDCIDAQVYLERLGDAIELLVKRNFPGVKHTLTSRQEYEP